MQCQNVGKGGKGKPAAGVKSELKVDRLLRGLALNLPGEYIWRGRNLRGRSGGKNGRELYNTVGKQGGETWCMMTLLRGGGRHVGLEPNDKVSEIRKKLLYRKCTRSTGEGGREKAGIPAFKGLGGSTGKRHGWGAKEKGGSKGEEKVSVNDM